MASIGSIFDMKTWGSGRLGSRVRSMTKTASMLRREVSGLRKVVDEKEGKIQHLTLDRADVAQTTGSTTYTGNPYQSYAAQVAELDRKFMGLATWGNQVTQNVVALRSSFTVGSGVRAVPAIGGAERELDFINAFMRHNNIATGIAMDWVREAELEGKFLVAIVPVADSPDSLDGKMGDGTIPGIIEARYISWNTHTYKVTTLPMDYSRYTGVDYKVAKTGKEVHLNPDEFVYSKFGGRTDSVNETPPRLGPVLRQLEDLDKALYDWRLINNLYASPTPWVDADDDAAARSIYDGIKQMNWKVGRLLVTSGARFAMVEAASGRGIDSLEKEIITNAKFISGASGVPVHFLGLPDLLSNRATADNLVELVVGSTARERQIWIGFYTELFRKVLRMANTIYHAGFNERAVGADIPFVSGSKLKELAEVWLPLYMANALDLGTFLSKVPEIDAAAVEKKLAEKAEQDALNLAASIRIPGQEDDSDDRNPRP